MNNSAAYNAKAGRGCVQAGEGRRCQRSEKCPSLHKVLAQPFVPDRITQAFTFARCEYNSKSVDIQFLHHVSLTVSDLERSRQFYREVLRLSEIARPPFPFAGAWFQVGDNQHVHLIVHAGATFRGMQGINTRDSHFAVRVRSYREAIGHLRSLGYGEEGDDLDLKKMKLQPHGTAGFPQIYILDPDRHVIEVNAAVLDGDASTF